MIEIALCGLAAILLAPAAFPPPAPVDEYAIYQDGGLVYNPLSREAEKTGQMARYAKAGTTRHELSLDGYHLTLDVPKAARAYDVVPISYTLEWDENVRGRKRVPVAVEATAFEDEARRQGRDLHDLALPGRLDLKVEYLGSITAHIRPEGSKMLKPDFSDTPVKYPNYERKPFTRSGVVEAGDLVWFKFRYTNTGDTILDPEGLGGITIEPELHRTGPDGNYVHAGGLFNGSIRDLEYLYPGESHETWVQFLVPGDGTPQDMGLTPGQYRIAFRMRYRTVKDQDWWRGMSLGEPMHIWLQPFAVEKSARKVAVPEGEVTLTDGACPDKITRWLHTFEEFMTAFDCHQSLPENASRLDGTVHLQVAPWTKQVVIKLIGANPVGIATKAIPIKVDTTNLKITYKPDHQATIVKNGLREPVITTQTMADYRQNVQCGPFPDRHLRDDIRKMKDCGINVISTTNGREFQFQPDITGDASPGRKYSCQQADAIEYFLDLARVEGIRVGGIGTYPFAAVSNAVIANWATGSNIHLATTTFVTESSQEDPNLARACALTWLYEFGRWGDNYYATEKGEVIFETEDTRGWIRDDINIRHPLGDLSKQAFQDWARRKYGDIDAANKAWGSSYSGFDQIDPEADHPEGFAGAREFFNPKNPFHDWSPAIADFDQFRTEQRVQNYKDTLAALREEIPGAALLVRTEGGNVIVDGIDPSDPNVHMRHIYYIQRRCGFIADIVQKSGTVRFHSDYTTIPYTPSELRMLTRKSVEQGIIPAYLAQFDRMRDPAVNTKYGVDYQIHYNLPEPRKAAMMNVLTALYPWFQSVYEEGGVPGVLWADYACDGFVTETQVREMKLFRKKLREAMNTPEARKARVVTNPVSEDWRNKSKGKWSFEIGK